MIKRVEKDGGMGVVGPETGGTVKKRGRVDACVRTKGEIRRE